MAFFGLTQYGISDYIKYVRRPEYKEPDESVSILELHKMGIVKRNFFEISKELDIPSVMNGFSYGSHKRINLQRRIGCTNAFGPTDIYRYPITDNMNYGWWIYDDKLKNETWMKKTVHAPTVNSEITRFIDLAMQNDKNLFFQNSGTSGSSHS